MSRSELKKWPVLRQLDPEFLTKIHMVFVYSDEYPGDQAVIVTKDDMVYAISSNQNGPLKTSDTHSTPVPKKVQDLCQKGVKTFASGEDFVVALTNSGEVYSWRFDESSQHGYGTPESILIPSIVCLPTDGKVIVNIDCSMFHSLALTDEGEVFAWGLNECGQLGNGLPSHAQFEVANPTRVNAALTGENIVSIACGLFFSMAVTDGGEVYGWGHNEDGQLGLGNYTNQGYPSKVTTLASIVIVKVVCGPFHTLALSDEGALYVWGNNANGQLGQEIGDMNAIPTKLSLAEKRKVSDIAAVNCNDISVAMGHDNCVYVWGSCEGQSIRRPLRIPVARPQDALDFYATDRMMHQPLVLHDEKETSNPGCPKNASDDASTSTEFRKPL